MVIAKSERARRRGTWSISEPQPRSSLSRMEKRTSNSQSNATLIIMVQRISGRYPHFHFWQVPYSWPAPMPSFGITRIKSSTARHSYCFLISREKLSNRPRPKRRKRAPKEGWLLDNIVLIALYISMAPRYLTSIHI